MNQAISEDLSRHTPVENAHPTADRYASSLNYMARARKLIPRGVTSAKRAALRPTPLVFASAHGSHIKDIDGNDYIDYVGGYGPLLLGHGFEPVDSAVIEQLRRGTLFGGQHTGEADLAELLINAVPSAEKVLLNVTGSEADHAALRLARAATGRRLIVKFAGHYHGWIDPVTANGPGTSEPHTPAETASPAYAFNNSDVLVCKWNDAQALRNLLSEVGTDTAAVILEPVAVNAGALAPDEGYLQEVRELCTRYGALLIFDEVVTGFRVALGGAQERYSVTPDLTVLGKAIAGGHQLSAVVGRADALDVAETKMSWAGTFNGHALAVAAATATIRHLTEHRNEIYPRLEQISSALVSGIKAAAQAADAPLTAVNVGSVVRLHWNTPSPTNNYENVLLGDAQSLSRFSSRLVDQGIHSRESGTWYISAAHTPSDIEQTTAAVTTALESMTNATDSDSSWRLDQK